jgi:hypothetical protein
VEFKRKQIGDKMGLDMYAYVGRKGQYRDHYYNDEAEVPKPREIAYWRKHPTLHGWMEKLWVSKGMPGISDMGTGFNVEYGMLPSTQGFMNTDFNGIELELTWEDVDNLERAVRHGTLPSTQGFFFGNPADEVYFEQDLEFCINAKAELFLGLKVFYNSSW